MSVSSVKRGRDGKLRYTREGRAYVVRADGARFYVGGGAAERVYCTRDVRQFLRGEAKMLGGNPNGPGQARLDTLPENLMSKILSDVPNAQDRAHLAMTSQAMNELTGMPKWTRIGEMPVGQFAQIVRTLNETDCRALNAALGRIAAANPIGAQYADEDDQDRAMAAWIGAHNKMEIVAARLAVIQAAPGAAAQAPGAAAP